MFSLKEYQEKAINELVEKINDYLSQSNKTCVFRSPTGSGKTVMMGEAIKRLVEKQRDSKGITFIWIAVHKLHDQSKKRLERHYEDSQTTTCSFFEELEDNQIQDGEILFLNWQSINQEDNIYIRENELEFTLSKVVENTKDAGREIIVIIDESHHTADSEKSKELIRQIAPRATIKVSATPSISGTDDLVSVDVDKVKSEEMIKKSIHVNHEVSENNDPTTDELILRHALDKRAKLKKFYEMEGSDVNPLVLIQISDLRRGMPDKKKKLISILDSEFRINTNNGKLAIYLSASDDKINLENIEKNNNEVEVLIFKQAITVGWDCPRAAILVLFREWKEVRFSMQTVGRIIRMPETVYYDSNELNHAYVYANYPEIQIVEDVADDYFTRYEATRKIEFEYKLNLKSIYRKRKNELTRFNMEFNSIFDLIIEEQQLHDKILLEVLKLNHKILTNIEIDELREVTITEGNMLTRDLNPEEIENLFNRFIIESVKPFAKQRSSEILTNCMERFFEDKLHIDDYDRMHSITIHPKNQPYFTHVFREAKSRYTRDVVDRIMPEIEYFDWNVPKQMTYTDTYQKKDYKKYVMEPAYVRIDSELEEKFIDLLEDDNKVKWWFKNGVNDRRCFAIKYHDSEDSQDAPFYVDFIICMKDGRIGLFDPKDGMTAHPIKSKAKSEALVRYIQDNLSKNLFGGIAILDKNGWVYNDQDEYNYNRNDFSDWKPIILN